MAGRRIKRAKIHTIALCKRGANRLPGIYKSDDKGGLSVQTLLKVSDDFKDNGELTAVVYAPELEDSQNEVASAEVIKEMAHEFIKNGAKINIAHDGEPLPPEKAFVAETFIIQKGDPRFEDMTDTDGEPVDVTGGWGTVIKIEDPALREKYRSGEWNGVSMEGVGAFESSKADDAAEALARRKRKESANMDEKKLAELMKANNEALVAGISKTLKDEIVPLFKTPKGVEKDDSDDSADDKPTKKSSTIKFVGDPTNAKDLKKHAEKIRKAKAIEDLDFNDPDALEAAAADLAKANDDADGDDGDGTEDDVEGVGKQKAGHVSDIEKAAGILATDSTEVRRLKKELHKAQRASKQSTSGGEGGTKDEYERTTELGSSIAKEMNKKRGFAVS